MELALMKNEETALVDEGDESTAETEMRQRQDERGLGQEEEEKKKEERGVGMNDCTGGAAGNIIAPLWIGLDGTGREQKDWIKCRVTG